MKLQPTISKTIFYSFLFAIGGSPTLAMLIIYGQNYNPDFFMTAFMSLSVLIACVLIPVVLIQNSYLLWKRKNPNHPIYDKQCVLIFDECHRPILSHKN